MRLRRTRKQRLFWLSIVNVESHHISNDNVISRYLHLSMAIADDDGSRKLLAGLEVDATLHDLDHLEHVKSSGAGTDASAFLILSLARFPYEV
jgi:hypothetical protein